MRVNLFYQDYWLETVSNMMGKYRLNPVDILNVYLF